MNMQVLNRFDYEQLITDKAKLLKHIESLEGALRAIAGGPSICRANPEWHVVIARRALKKQT